MDTQRLSQPLPSPEKLTLKPASWTPLPIKPASWKPLPIRPPDAQERLTLKPRDAVAEAPDRQDEREDPDLATTALPLSPVLARFIDNWAAEHDIEVAAWIEQTLLADLRRRGVPGADQIATEAATATSSRSRHR
jgi:hypothetical protein